MRRAWTLALLVAVPVAAKPPLVPTAELEARLAALEERRDAIDVTRQRAWNLKIAAGAGYGICLYGAAMIIGEVVAADSRRAMPLSGVPTAGPVPLAVLVTVTVAVALGGAAMHVLAYALEHRAEAAQDALEDEERPVRRQLDEAHDVVPD